eukprot:CAMPEP_0175083756 /NCGR_PEP_ID=MMETSP0052_2-20121109/27591_1 /TAXON_ID=51329 ORGANISM="Polytomella parva, Strain SAG 63-3" /NCGR_SAMPLE_ID=MMETSP0052_2 /ASSEMBLY_ACC=CAM_ASM_000194 /LENGTH=136 /DNA_ID=CAMNT_0016355305 /DNA_START=70 /DNA_END=477 /DNA_ORIENTATION=+
MGGGFSSSLFLSSYSNFGSGSHSMAKIHSTHLLAGILNPGSDMAGFSNRDTSSSLIQLEHTIHSNHMDSGHRNDGVRRLHSRGSDNEGSSHIFRSLDSMTMSLPMPCLDFPNKRSSHKLSSASSSFFATVAAAAAA